ncbi:HEAT repeat domain-containing protein [Anatilimnocola sp. NA78]|uniref:HEAT repeat domain-containing protein n=1 Tax=Anatilimnocola sp. NA78 TaxID=3415683 RepID=UPI003CE4EF56
MKSEEELKSINRDLNSVRMMHHPNLPLPDEATLRLLTAIRRIDGFSRELGQWEQNVCTGGIIVLGYRLHPPQTGAMSEAQHQALTALLEYTTSPNPWIAGSAAHSLGMLKRREGIPALQRIIQDEGFVDDPTHPITVRGVAFRALMRIDREAARELIGTRACREYLVGVDNWLRDARPGQSPDELLEESAWLRES